MGCFRSLLRSPPLPVVHHRRCGFSSIIVGRIFLVLSTGELFFILAWDRNVVWDGRAIDGNFWLEKSIDTPSRRIYDLLLLIEYSSVEIESYKFEFRRSGAF